MWATVLMSALQNGTEDIENFSKLTKFYQPVPIPSYLIAIAVGNLVSKRVGPRSSVWSEKELIEQSAYEFGETDTMLRTAEEICGPYVWGKTFFKHTDFSGSSFLHISDLVSRINYGFFILK